MSNSEPRGEALCVRVLWGERRVATHLIHAGGKLALGATGESVAATEAPLQFEAGTRHFSLAFQEGVVGQLLRNGQTPLTLGDAVHRGLAVEEQRGWSFDIGRADVLRLGNGPVSVEAFRVRAPPRALGSLEVDYRFLNTLLVCFALFFGLAVQAQLSEAEDSDAPVSSEVTRMRHILVKSEKPPPPKRNAEVVAEVTKKPVKRDAAEGSPRPPKRPQKDPGGGAAPPTALQIANSIFGGKGANNVLGPGGLGKDLTGALGNVVANNGTGEGGWSIKGNGAGGENGDPERIGAIPRSGVDSKKGFGELCLGPGPCKKISAPPGLPVETVVDCVGTSCIDKELIRKVINGHRDQIRFCYELALQQAPALAGKVSVQFAVASSGFVAQARVENSSARSEALSECLVSRVRTWQFPVGKQSAGYKVTYPFVFKPSGS
ncbi:MAG: AgmX/PglI C-terminal domain-containing protein [Archangium sp.]|nr:AgmX/PglI C-terminal domain-containing protein [Archangium sp.]MDP3576176.1 AgmX/PglI C-terminal domain-containing protein [Archangium sp.]